MVAPRHAYLGSIGQLGDLEARGRVRAVLVDIADTDAVIAAPRGRGHPLDRVADQPGPRGRRRRAARRARAHAAGASVVVDNTFATPLLQQPLELGADIVLHSVTKFLAGHSDVVMGALVVRDAQLYDVLKGRRDLVGAIPGTFEAWLALRGLRTLHLRSSARRPTPPSSPAGSPSTRRSRGPLPRLRRRSSPPCSPTAEAADLLTHGTSLWVHATSLGSVESTFERRRRWKGEAATIPEGLVRLSVGIEDVEDLWADLEQALGRYLVADGAIIGWSTRVFAAGDRRPRLRKLDAISRSRPWCRGR